MRDLKTAKWETHAMRLVGLAVLSSAFSGHRCQMSDNAQRMMECRLWAQLLSVRIQKLRAQQTPAWKWSEGNGVKEM
jgi:hypothetical protein